MVRRSSPRGACVMSPSMRSKPASETSQLTGAEKEASVTDEASPTGVTDAGTPARPGSAPPHDAAGRPRGERSGSRSARPTQIELEVSRQRSIGWTIFGLIVGALLIHGL